MSRFIRRFGLCATLAVTGFVGLYGAPAHSPGVPTTHKSVINQQASALHAVTQRQAQTSDSGQITPAGTTVVTNEVINASDSGRTIPTATTAAVTHRDVLQVSEGVQAAIPAPNHDAVVVRTEVRNADSGQTPITAINAVTRFEGHAIQKGLGANSAGV